MNIYRVVITGPESTGKTTLAENLASVFNTAWVPEYAREYISGLGRRYNYDDVEHIARVQETRESDYLERASRFLFFDTHLVVIKVWFKVLYGKYPLWIDKALTDSGIGLFLVCNTDIPWMPDPLRENGGEMRDRLLKMYTGEIESLDIPWRLVSGKGQERIDCAGAIMDQFFKL